MCENQINFKMSEMCLKYWNLCASKKWWSPNFPRWLPVSPPGWPSLRRKKGVPQKKRWYHFRNLQGSSLIHKWNPKLWSMLHKILVKIAEANWIFKEFSFQCAQTLGPWKAQVLIHEKRCQRILFSENCSFADRVHWFTFFILINFCKDPSKKELNKYTDPHFNAEIL